jgi:hypothetical protein
METAPLAMNAMFAGEVLQTLYDSEVNFAIETDWDGDFHWRLQNDPEWSARGTGSSLAEAVQQLAAAAIRSFPGSNFAIWWEKSAA